MSVVIWISCGGERARALSSVGRGERLKRLAQPGVIGGAESLQCPKHIRCSIWTRSRTHVGMSIIRTQQSLPRRASSMHAPSTTNAKRTRPGLCLSPSSMMYFFLLCNPLESFLHFFLSRKRVHKTSQRHMHRFRRAI